MIPELSGSKCRYIQSFFTGLEIKRASLERDFPHRPYVYSGINFHTARIIRAYAIVRHRSGDIHSIKGWLTPIKARIK